MRDQPAHRCIVRVDTEGEGSGGGPGSRAGGAHVQAPLHIGGDVSLGAADLAADDEGVALRAPAGAIDSMAAVAVSGIRWVRR